MSFGSSYSSNNAGPDNRSGYSHTYSHPAHQGFTVAGMSSLGGSTLQSPSLRGGPLGGGLPNSTSFGSGGSLSSLSESRSHYQTGYLMVCGTPAVYVAMYSCIVPETVSCRGKCEHTHMS